MVYELPKKIPPFPKKFFSERFRQLPGEEKRRLRMGWTRTEEELDRGMQGLLDDLAKFHLGLEERIKGGATEEQLREEITGFSMRKKDLREKAEKMAKEAMPYFGGGFKPQNATYQVYRNPFEFRMHKKVFRMLPACDSSIFNAHERIKTGLRR